MTRLAKSEPASRVRAKRRTGTARPTTTAQPVVSGPASPSSQRRRATTDRTWQQKAVELESELQELRGQQRATSDILRVISGSPIDLQSVLNAVANHAARLCDARDAFIIRVADDGLQIVAHSGKIPTEEMGTTFPILPGYAAGTAVLTRQVVHVRDLAGKSGAKFPETQSLQGPRGVRTLLVVPLLRDGAAIGVISIRRQEVRPFSARQVALVRTFADEAVIALENTRLFGELERHNKALTEALEQQTATSEILRVISSSPTDLQPVLDAVAKNAALLCHASDASVFRVQGELLILAGGHGRRVGERGRLEVGEGVPIQRDMVMGRAIIDRKVVHVPDLAAASDEEFAAGKAFGGRFGLRTMLAVPMIREGAAIGLIGLTTLDVRPFTDAQIQLVKTFADQAVIAIENVRLFQELHSRTQQLAQSVEQLKALAEVSQAVNSTLDLQKVLESIVTRAVQLSDTTGGAVYEFDDKSRDLQLRATYGLEADLVEVLLAKSVRFGEGASGRAAAERAPVEILDLKATSVYTEPLNAVIDRMGIRAILALPLMRENRVLGTLTVARKSVGKFEPQIIGLLQTFAAQSALAIQNARLFREIEQKSRELEIASRHKSQFLANMSHELRTPLNAILGYTELIVDQIYGPVPEKILEVLDRVEKSGRHLLGLINDVLDLSKIEAGQLTLSLGDFSFKDVAQSVVSALGSLANEKRLPLEVDVQSDLPIGRGDERRITQVLLNLVGNAIKFTESGRVSVRVTASNGAFLAAVADTGPGIRAEDQEKIFEEFQQSDNSSTKVKGGTGLGLAIAKRIVEMHGGRIWLESTVGKGATFFFSIPVRAEQRGVAA